MRRIIIIFILAVLTLAFSSFAFADETADIKDDAVNQALKEEAMRQAFQEAAIMDMSDQAEASLFNGKLLSYVHPYLGANLIYTDNVYSINTGVQSDLYAEINPGIKLILGDPNRNFESEKVKQGLQIDLGVDIVHSFYHPVALNFEAPYGGLLYRLESRNNTLSFNQNFKSDYQLVSDITWGTAGITHYQSNVTNVLWEHRFNRLGFGLGYDRYAKDFYGIYKQGSTYIDNMGSLTAFWAITHKTRVFMEYDFGFYDYPRAVNTNSNFRYYQIWGGVRGELTKKIEGLVKFGSESREYETTPRKSMERTSVKIDLKYRQSAKNSFSASLYKGLLNTDYVSQGADDGYGFDLGFTRKLNSKLSFYTKGGFQADTYQSGTQSNATNASVGLKYAFNRWLRMELKYDYNHRSSTNSNSGYLSNKYSLLTRMEF